MVPYCPNAEITNAAPERRRCTPGSANGQQEALSSRRRCRYEFDNDSAPLRLRPLAAWWDGVEQAAVRRPVNKTTLDWPPDDTAIQLSARRAGRILILVAVNRLSAVSSLQTLHSLQLSLCLSVSLSHTLYVCLLTTDDGQINNTISIQFTVIIIIMVGQKIIIISVCSSQLRWSRLVHSMSQLVSFWRISGEGSPPSQVTREIESAFLFQRLSVAIQRFNAILLHNSFEAADHLG